MEGTVGPGSVGVRSGRLWFSPAAGSEEEEGELLAGCGTRRPERGPSLCCKAHHLASTPGKAFWVLADGGLFSFSGGISRVSSLGTGRGCLRRWRDIPRRLFLLPERSAARVAAGWWVGLRRPGLRPGCGGRLEEVRRWSLGVFHLALKAWRQLSGRWGMKQWDTPGPDLHGFPC